ncbi:hypothetical protein [Paraburkholderia sp. SIMBA_054]
MPRRSGFTTYLRKIYLPAEVNAVVERLYEAVAQDHDRIRALRDQYAPRS